MHHLSHLRKPKHKRYDPRRRRALARAYDALRLYEMMQYGVPEWLAERPRLISIVREIRVKLRDKFPGCAVKVLVDDWRPELHIYVLIRLDVDEALKRLDAFDVWWTMSETQRRAERLIFVSTEYLG